jgi:hypothetical protein
MHGLLKNRQTKIVEISASFLAILYGIARGTQDFAFFA